MGTASGAGGAGRGREQAMQEAGGRPPRPPRPAGSLPGMQRLPQRSRLRESKAHHVVENFVQIRKTWIFLWFLFFFRVGFFFLFLFLRLFFAFLQNFFFCLFFFLFSRIFPGRRRGEEEPVSTVLPCTASARGRARPGRRIPLKHHALCLLFFVFFSCVSFLRSLKKNNIGFHLCQALVLSLFCGFFSFFWWVFASSRPLGWFSLPSPGMSRVVWPRWDGTGLGGVLPERGTGCRWSTLAARGGGWVAAVASVTPAAPGRPAVASRCHLLGGGVPGDGGSPGAL